jgi:choline kinase
VAETFPKYNHQGRMLTQAVILAAGIGTRLRPLTDDRPKCLVEVGSHTILSRLLHQLATAGIKRALLTTGYRAEAIARHLAEHPAPLEVVLIPNPIYDTTNNAMSLFKAHQATNGEGFILCDGDVVLRRGPLQALLQEACECALLVEAKQNMGAEEMKAVVNSSYKVTQLAKTLEPNLCLGESIGIQKIGTTFAPLLWKTLSDMMQSGRDGAYYEEAFQRMIDHGVDFAATPVAASDWTEIDDLADLEDARARFADA